MDNQFIDGFPTKIRIGHNIWDIVCDKSDYLYRTKRYGETRRSELKILINPDKRSKDTLMQETIENEMPPHR